ncbi:MAG: hypothetical protein OQK49_01095 [Proteobacteria bacterium]|jgi:hypothetical protein|nr:hypothetical protein [Pseudomonadota bacterium]
MTAIKQNLLATSLLLTALSMSLLIGYWLNQKNDQSSYTAINHTTVEMQKFNKLNHSLVLLLPAIR